MYTFLSHSLYSWFTGSSLVMEQLFSAHLAHSAKVSFWGGTMSFVRRRAPYVVRGQQLT